MSNRTKAVNQLEKHPEENLPFVMKIDQKSVPSGQTITSIVDCKHSADLTIPTPSITGDREITLWVDGGIRNSEYAIEVHFERTDTARIVAEAILFVTDTQEKR